MATAATKSVIRLMGVLLSIRSAQRLERGPQVGDECRRLLPRCEVSALVVLRVVEEFGVRLLRPGLRRRVDLLGEGAHGDRDLYAPRVEEASLRGKLPGVPVELRGGDRGVRQPVERDVVEDVVPSQP